MSFNYTLRIISDVVLEEYFCQYSCFYNTYYAFTLSPLWEHKKEERFSFYYFDKVYLCAQSKKNTPSG